MNDPIRVWLGGEGPTELGDHTEPVAPAPRGRSKPPPRRDGIVAALLRRAAPGTPFEIVGATQWKAIRKYQAGEHRSRERRNVLGLALTADEGGAHVLAFARDRDGDTKRHTEVDQGIDDASKQYETLSIAGGVAVEAAESWVLALLGDSAAETYSQPKLVLEKREPSIDVHRMVEIVHEAAPASTSASLAVWLDRARAAFGRAAQR